jgi:phenylacetate-CoA ligase
MTATTDSGVNALRARFGQALASRLEQHVGRLSWDAGQLAAHQREQLQALLASALSSPFHARRLAGIEPGRFELSQLAELPVMTKEQMMASFDELPTDRRLTRARAEQQLAACADEPGLLYDQYVCLASGGSSGLRGVFVQTVGEYAEFAASIFRRAMARVSAAAGGLPPGGLQVAIVAGASPVHSSGFAAAVARGYPVRMIPAPATLPTGEVVRRLNDAQPPALLAHASTLVLLAGEQRAGRLRISPQAITSMSELLTERDRISVRDAFGVPPTDQFVSTEGLVGHSEPGGAVLSFATDMCIVELVDADNRPVPDGVPSAKVLVTNLHNHTQPLIRYELTDQFIRRPAAGDPYLHATVEGRADEVFRYGKVTIDPLVIRTVMVRTPNAIEYQVSQTGRGIDVTVVTDGALDRAALASSLEHSLRTAGLPDPHVHVHRVAEIGRHRETGKTRRFIRL